jgi:hypothetical protein
MVMAIRISEREEVPFQIKIVDCAWSKRVVESLSDD